MRAVTINVTDVDERRTSRLRRAATSPRTTTRSPWTRTTPAIWSMSPRPTPRASTPTTRSPWGNPLRVVHARQHGGAELHEPARLRGLHEGVQPDADRLERQRAEHPQRDRHRPQRERAARHHRAGYGLHRGGRCDLRRDVHGHGSRERHHRLATARRGRQRRVHVHHIEWPADLQGGAGLRGYRAWWRQRVSRHAPASRPAATRPRSTSLSPSRTRKSGGCSRCPQRGRRPRQTTPPPSAIPTGCSRRTWTWERSMSRSGPWAPVSGAVNSTTTTSVLHTRHRRCRLLPARDRGVHRCPRPPDKSPDAVSTNSVLAAPVSNTPPVFTETNPTRSVAENARANAPVGGPVTATDPNPGNTVRYEFDPVPDLFTIDASSGQIRVKTERALDYETQPMPTVTVKALDGSNTSDTVEVTDRSHERERAAGRRPRRPQQLRRGHPDRDPRARQRQRPRGHAERVAADGVQLGAQRTPSRDGERQRTRQRGRTPHDHLRRPTTNYHGSPTRFTYQVSDTGSPPVGGRSLSSTASVSVTDRSR